MSTVAIILLNYNSTRLTKKCVHSVRSFKEKEDEYTIIVYDNNSTHVPKKDEFAGCELVLSKKNYGFAEGNNKAVQYALQHTKDVDYILLLNNDTRVTKGMVRHLITAFEANTDAGIVVPKIYFEKNHEFHAQDYTKNQVGRVLWYAGGGIDWPNVILFHKGIDEVDRGQFDRFHSDSPLPSQSGYEAFATGCCMITTPKIWKKLHGFDSKYFLYYEDADLSLRLQRKLHKTILFEPKATLFHLNAGSSSGSGSALHQYYQTRNRLRFGLQYASLRTKLALLKEARKQFFSGNQAVKLGILDALGGRWGNQHHRIRHDKVLASSS